MSNYSSEGGLCFVEWRKAPWQLCIPTSLTLNILLFVNTVSFKYDFSMIKKILYFNSLQKTSCFRLLLFSFCQKFSRGIKGALILQNYYSRPKSLLPEQNTLASQVVFTFDYIVWSLKEIVRMNLSVMFHFKVLRLCLIVILIRVLVWRIWVWDIGEMILRDSKTNFSEKHPYKCHFPHCKSYML